MIEISRKRKRMLPVACVAALAVAAPANAMATSLMMGAGGATRAAPSESRALAVATEVPTHGLKPDDWGTTVSAGTENLREQYAGIVRASCHGVRMVGLPRGESTWTAKGKRWWDKLSCTGIAGRRSQFFSLIYDPKEVGWRTYRLKNITLSQLRQRPPAPPAATPPPRTPPPAPTPTPVPAPADTATKLLIDQAMAQVIRIGQTFDGLRDSTGIYYYWQSWRSECTRLSGDTARCWLYLWKQVEKQDSNFNRYIARYIFRINVFAVDLGRGAYSTYSNQADYVTPWRVECSDVAAEGAPRCSQ